MIRRTILATLAACLCFTPSLRGQAGTTGSVVNGHVVVQVFVTLSDDQTPYHPVAGLPLGFFRSLSDTAIAVTDRSGSATILLSPGTYRLVSLEPTQWKGLRYSWSLPIKVAESMSPIDLRQKEAMVSRVNAATVATLSDAEAAPAPRRMRVVPDPVAEPIPARVEVLDDQMPRVPSMGRSHSSGFFVGLGVEGDGLATNEIGSSAESGSGLGLILGYGFNHRWALYGDLSGAVMDNLNGGTYSLAHADLGARVHFRTGPNTVVPFLQFGLSGRSVAATVNGSSVTGAGGGIAFGGGLNVHFTPSVALSTAVTWSVGSFSDFRVDNWSVGNYSVDATTARVHLGLIWFPQ